MSYLDLNDQDIIAGLSGTFREIIGDQCQFRTLKVAPNYIPPGPGEPGAAKNKRFRDAPRKLPEVEAQMMPQFMALSRRGMPTTEIWKVLLESGSKATLKAVYGAHEVFKEWVPEIKEGPCSPSQALDGHKFKMAQIKETLCQVLGVAPDDLDGHSRAAFLVKCRFVFHYLAKKYAEMSLVQIGLRSGGRDHNTICNGISKVEKNLAEFQPFITAVEQALAESISP
jgi:hypothetical protein